MFHWGYTSTGGVTEYIILPVVSVSMEIYLCWWSHRGYHPPSSQCFNGDIPLLVESPRISSAQYSVFNWRYTSAGGVTEDIILPVVSVSLEIYLCWWSNRGYHPPLVESSRIRPVVSVSLEIYLYWWSHRRYHSPNSQCFTGDIPLLVGSPRISSAQ